MIEFDVETTGLQPFSGRNEAFLWIFKSDDHEEAIPFSPSGDPIEAWSVRKDERVQRAAANCNAMSDESRGENQRRIQAWFDLAAEDPEGIRAWNAKFDRAFAEMAGCFNIPGDGKWHDGMLVAHAVDERRSVALKAVAQQLFGKEAADPQKALKDWLNAENRRRAQTLRDAEKAEAGTLKIKYVEKIDCEECHGEGCYLKPGLEYATSQGDWLVCEACEGHGGTEKNRTRKPTDEEVEALVFEAKDLLDPETGDYKRANYSHVPREIMEPYALEDVILTRRVCDTYAGVLGDKSDLARVVEFERKAMDALFAIEKRGLPTSARDYRRLEQEVIDNLEQLRERVMDLAQEGDPIVYAEELGVGVEVDETGLIKSFDGPGGRLRDFNPNSSAQILAALKARGADLTHMSQKDGKLPVDADNLRAVDDALAVAILDYRAENKVLTTYVRPMIGRSYVSSMNVYKEPFIAPDSRIHTTYRQVGARTGRMSSADPNVQNQPRDDLRLRYNIAAEDGYVLVACDLTNIEMVLFAAYCGEGRLLNAVRAGEDLHVLTAKMLGLRDRKRPGGGVETARQQGKTYNFSRIYGGGLRTIRRSFRCSMDEARVLKNRFDKAYPEVGRLAARIEYRLEDDGYIQDKLISGRRFRVEPREAYKATNYLVQGTAASLLKYAVIKLHDDGVPMVALVHDEIVAHVPVAEAQEAALLIEKRMTEFEGLKGIVPLRAEAEIIKRWSDAKPLKNDDGSPYLFTPQWAGGKRRPILTPEEVLAAA